MTLEEFRFFCAKHPHSKEILKGVNGHDPVGTALDQLSKNVEFDIDETVTMSRVLDSLKAHIETRYD